MPGWSHVTVSATGHAPVTEFTPDTAVALHLLLARYARGCGVSLLSVTIHRKEG